MTTGKVILGVLAGAAAGALAGILFAPAKGSKTRRRILKKGKNYKDAVKKEFTELLDVITEKFDKVKTEVSDLADKKMDAPEAPEMKTNITF